MKLSALSLPIFLSGLLFVAIWGLGQLTVQAGQTATQTSLELLRQQLEIQRLQEQLTAHTRGQVLKELEELPWAQSRSTEGLEPSPPSAPREAPEEPEPPIAPIQPKPWPTS